MPNRLAEETSPYLLQHAENPVDWFPWGEEALSKARAEDKPILLSIGYSACHWCHVMERESFEDEDTAALMNEGFVNIKVDREERPDLDSIYMRAVQASVGRGGWPLTAFLTPDGRFFYGGHLLSPGTQARDALLPAGAGRRRRRLPEPARGDRGRIGPSPDPSPGRVRPGWDPAWSRGRNPGGPPHPDRFPNAGSGRPLPGGSVRPRPRRVRPGAEVPATGHPGIPPAPLRPNRERRGAGHGPDDAPIHVPGRNARSSGRAGSTGIRWTTVGWCPTSRRCSTTTDFWPGSISRPSRSPGTPSSRTSPPRPWTTSWTTFEIRPEDSTPPGTRIRRGRRDSSTSGAFRRSRRFWAMRREPSSPAPMT